MNTIDIPQKIDVAYLLPSLTISGGIGIVMRHVYELNKLGRKAVIFALDTSGNGDWYHLRSNILIYHIDEYYNICGNEGSTHLVATWWETAFLITTLSAKHKHYFLQSLENRFYQDNDIYKSTFFLSLFLDLDIFTEANWIKKWIKECLNRDIVVVPNGIDTSIFFPVERLKNKSEKLRVLIEGTIDVFYKGVNECFQVVDELDVEVWFVTPYGKPKPHWRVDNFFCNIPINKMNEIYSSCDVLLKMSKVEGVFGPPLEMMACGGTCVVGDVTGYDEYCEHEINSLVVDVNSISEAKSAISRLINDRTLLNRLKNEGIKTAERFKWDISAEILNKSVYTSSHETQRNILYDENIIRSFNSIKKYIDICHSSYNLHINLINQSKVLKMIDRIYNKTIKYLSKIFI